MDPAEAAAEAAEATEEPVVEAEATEEPVVEPVPEEATVPESTEQSFPWDKDVAERFTDPAQAKSVSDFMREKYAPYTTKIEQERAELRDQAALFNQFVEDPDNTLLEVVSELYPEADAEKVKAFFAEINSEAEPEAAKDMESEGGPPASALSEDDQAALEWAREQRTASADKKAMDEYLSDAKPVMEANPDIPESVFHRYVATSDGDFDTAVAAYRNDHPAPEEPEEKAPPVMSSGTSAGSRGRNYGKDLDAALDRAWSGLKK